MNNDLRGMKFLSKVFKDLYQTENINIYRRFNDHLGRGNHIKFLAKKLVDNYVIKEENIPDGKDKKQIIFSQKSSLECWVNYLIECDYPMWIKYYIFRSLIKIGTYSKFYNTFQVRSKKTLAPFIELNYEALAKTVESVMSCVDGKTLNDKNLDILVKAGSFKKIYAFYLVKLSEKTKIYGNDGIWVKYQQETDDYIKLSESLKGYSTGWCIVNLETARKQMYDSQGEEDIGDFYVYYSADENGLYKIPRIAIRMCGHDKILEIRGILLGQNLESGLEDILETKLREMCFLSEEDRLDCLKKIHNSKLINCIVDKHLNGEILSIDEIKIIYGLVDCKTFGMLRDDRLDRLVLLRNHQADFEKLDRDSKLKLLISCVDLNIVCNDKALLLEAVGQDGFALEYADDELMNDRAFMFDIVKKNGCALKYASDKLKNDKEIVLEAVGQDGYNLFYASKELRNDKEVVLEALKQNKSIIKYVGEKLKHEEGILLFSMK